MSTSRDKQSVLGSSSEELSSSVNLSKSFGDESEPKTGIQAHWYDNDSEGLFEIDDIKSNQAVESGPTLLINPSQMDVFAQCDLQLLLKQPNRLILEANQDYELAVNKNQPPSKIRLTNKVVKRQYNGEEYYEVIDVEHDLSDFVTQYALAGVLKWRDPKKREYLMFVPCQHLVVKLATINPAQMTEMENAFLFDVLSNCKQKYFPKGINSLVMDVNHHPTIPTLHLNVTLPIYWRKCMNAKIGDRPDYRYEVFMDEPIGDGVSAQVSKGEVTLEPLSRSFHSKPSKYAIKFFKREDALPLSQARSEARLGRTLDYVRSKSPSRFDKLSHELIPGDTVAEQQNVVILNSRFIKGTSLTDILAQDDEYDDVLNIEHRMWIMIGLAGCLEHIHALNIIHRDIKPDNILVNLTVFPPKVYIIDLGLSRLATSVEGKMVGTPLYLAPEVWAEEGTTYKSDIFALGIVFGRIMRAIPSNFKDVADVVIAANNYQFNHLFSDINENSLSQERRIELEELFQSMVNVDPSKRPNARVVKRRLEETAFAIKLMSVEAQYRPALEKINTLGLADRSILLENAKIFKGINPANFKYIVKVFENRVKLPDYAVAFYLERLNVAALSEYLRNNESSQEITMNAVIVLVKDLLSQYETAIKNLNQFKEDAATLLRRKYGNDTEQTILALQADKRGQSSEHKIARLIGDVDLVSMKRIEKYKMTIDDIRKLTLKLVEDLSVLEGDLKTISQNALNEHAQALDKFGIRSAASTPVVKQEPSRNDGVSQLRLSL